VRITSIETQTFFVPFSTITRWHWGTRRGADRLLIRIGTDEGIIGLGETEADSKPTVEGLAPLLIGEDPFDIERILAKCQLQTFSRSVATAVAGLEIAIWDILGKYCGVPVSKLLGGIYKESVPISGWVHFRYGRHDESTPEGMTKSAKSLIKDYGYGTIKLKLGVLDTSSEINAIRMVREEIGPEVNLRIDPDAAWTLGTAVNVLKRVDDLNVEYAEDPFLTGISKGWQG
jgi:glucarate dehydratase